MATFKTLDGQQWLIDVTYLTVKRVRDLCGVNVLDICNLDKGTLSGWVADDLKVLEVVCAVVRTQLAERDMSDEDFFAACNAEVLKEAVERLVDRVSDFFQEPRKGLVKRVIQKLRETEKKMEAKAAQAIEQALQQCDFEAALATPGSSDSTSPASAESSPGASRSASSSGLPMAASTKTGRTRRR
jgi:polyhydroxyalkanoate synthesis regulator phasin